MKASVLIVEDEIRSAQWLKTYLERAGFSTDTAHDGRTGLEMARSGAFDLALLDIMLPRLQGDELCRILRRESDIPIIMLTAKGSREDRISGLDGGADDYIVKPFEPEEVIVRIKAVLRRTRGQVKKLVTCGKISADTDREEVFVDGEHVPMSHTQFSVLMVFMMNPDIVLSRRRIIEQAFDNDFDAYERAVDTHIRRLRKLLHHGGFEPIRTIYGGGYKLTCGSS